MERKTNNSERRTNNISEKKSNKNSINEEAQFVSSLKNLKFKQVFREKESDEDEITKDYAANPLKNECLFYLSVSKIN